MVNGMVPPVGYRRYSGAPQLFKSVSATEVLNRARARRVNQNGKAEVLGAKRDIGSEVDCGFSS